MNKWIGLNPESRLEANEENQRTESKCWLCKFHSPGKFLKKKISSLKKSKIQKLKIKNVNKSCSVLSKKKQCNKENHLKIIVNYSEKILIIQSQHMILKLHYEIYVMIIYWYYWYSILYFDILSKIFLKNVQFACLVGTVILKHMK